MASTPYILQRTAPVTSQNSPFSAVAAGAKSFARVPVGVTYLEHIFEFKKTGGTVAATKAEIAAQVSVIRFLVDSVVMAEVSGAEALALERFYRPATVDDTGLMTWYWARPWMQSIANQDGPAYGLLGKDSYTVEVVLAAGATIDTINLFNVFTQGENLGSHIEILRQNYFLGATGVLEIDNLPKDPSRYIYALHIAPPSGAGAVLTNVQLLADSFEEMNCPPAILKQQAIAATAIRSWQTGWTHLDFVLRNRDEDSMRTLMRDLRLKLTWGTAKPDNVTIIIEQASIDIPKGQAPATA